jgi:hypothetical protein
MHSFQGRSRRPLVSETPYPIGREPAGQSLILMPRLTWSFCSSATGLIVRGPLGTMGHGNLAGHPDELIQLQQAPRQPCQP